MLRRVECGSRAEQGDEEKALELMMMMMMMVMMMMMMVVVVVDQNRRIFSKGEDGAGFGTVEGRGRTKVSRWWV